MTSRERRGSRAAYLMDRDRRKAADDLRESRLRSGLTLEQVGAVIGVSESTVLRAERNIGPGPRPEFLARHADAVGLRARILLYPADDPIHDAPQVRLLRDFRASVGADLPMDIERPVIAIPGTGDRRAFDAVIRLPGCDCGVECYTRFHDCQAQLRAALLKQRDAQLPRLLIVVRGTRANRIAVAAAADLIALNFPLGTKAVLGALRVGKDPGANGLVFI
ncbi:MAG: helix-turn-helix domain-containing protein [Candidatus Limnocylindria bacterium]